MVHPRQVRRRPLEPDTSVDAAEPQADHAWKTLALVNDWIRHSDAKAGVTLAFTGVLATIVFNLARDFDRRTTLFDAIVVLACLLLVATAALCGWTLTPRVKDASVDPDAVNRLFFGSIAHHYKGKRADYRSALSVVCTDPSQLIGDIADQVHANATIAAIKAKAVKRAIRAAFAAAALVVALAVTVGVSNS